MVAAMEFHRGEVHAGIPGAATGGGGGVWSSLGLEERSGGPHSVGETFMQWSGECFYRSRRFTALEPQGTLVVFSGEAEKVNLVG